MPDNWGFVIAAYTLTAVVLGLYWRHLVRKEKELATPTQATTTGSARTVAGTARAHTERTSRSGHPRPDPSTRGPLQP